MSDKPNKGRVKEIQVCYHNFDDSYTVVTFRGCFDQYTNRYMRPTRESLKRLARLSCSKDIRISVTLLAGDGSPAIFYRRG